MKYKGIHIIGDLSDCNLECFVETKKDLPKLKRTITAIIKHNNLSEMGNFYYYFGKNAVTGVISLTESHISFHTWPEDNYVTVDVYVCNYSRNNEKGARLLFDYLCKEIFKSKNIKKRIIHR